MAKSQTTHTLDLSEERYAVALSWLDANRVKLAHFDREEQTMTALALLICDANGYFSKADLASALADPRAVSAANLLVNGSVN